MFLNLFINLLFCGRFSSVRFYYKYLFDHQVNFYEFDNFFKLNKMLHFGIDTQSLQNFA